MALSEAEVPADAQESAGAGGAGTNLLSFLNKTEGPTLPSRQGETPWGPELNGKGFYAV